MNRLLSLLVGVVVVGGSIVGLVVCVVGVKFIVLLGLNLLVGLGLVGMVGEMMEGVLVWV